MYRLGEFQPEAQALEMESSNENWQVNHHSQGKKFIVGCTQISVLKLVLISSYTEANIDREIEKSDCDCSSPHLYYIA